nr:immunoglobulin light chain junction region [Macaca mulatta]
DYYCCSYTTSSAVFF